MAEAGVGVIPIRADLSGVGKDLGRVGKQLDDVGAQSGRSFAAQFASNAGRDLNRLGGSITGALGKAFKVGAVAVGAGIATSIGLGLKRLVGIEEAQAKLRGLGHDAATVDKVMVNALASVKGTSFGLADAATAAAGAVASGVKPGKDLERTLKLVGDTATIAGAGFDEMGGIFNKVAASNRLTMGEVNQLADRGIPIMQWLADQYGVTAEEARKMVEDGKVNFADFRTAIETNIGGAALESGDTTMGAFNNMKAAAGRFGAALIGPVFTQVRDFFGGNIERIDRMTEAVGPLAERIGNAIPAAFSRLGAVASPIIERVVGAFTALYEWAQRNSEQIGKVAQAVLPAVGVIAALAVSVNLVSTAFALLKLATPIGALIALVSAVIYAYQNFEGFRNVVNAVVQFLTGTVAPAVANFAGLVAAKFGELAGWVRTHWAAIQEAIGHVINVVKAVIGAFVDVVLKLWRQWGDDLLRFAKEVWAFIQRTVENTLAVIRGVIQTVLSVINGDWGKAWDGIKTILAAVWDQMKNIVNLALDAVRFILGAALSAFREKWDAAWNGIKGALGAAWDAIKSLVGAGIGWVQDRIGSVTAAISGAWNQTWSGVRDTLAGIWDSIKSKASDTLEGLKGIVRGAVDTIGTIFNGIRGAFARPINWVIDNVINRFLGGVRSIAGTLGFSLDIGNVANVPTYHKGGVAGDKPAGYTSLGDLKDDEVTAVLQRGEGIVPLSVMAKIGEGGFADLLAGNGAAVKGLTGDEIGGPWDWVKDKASDLLGAARGLIADVVRPAIQAAMRLTDSMTSSFGAPGKLVGGIARKVGDGVLGWIEGVDSEAGKKMTADAAAASAAMSGPVGPGGPVGRGYRSLIAKMQGSGVPFVVTSTVRPGDRGAHGQGRATDFSVAGHGNKGYGAPGLARIFNYLAGSVGSLSQLILGGAPALGGKNPRSAWRSPGQAGNHWNHVHAATLHKGGHVTPQGITPLRPDELMAKLQVGETVLPKGDRSAPLPDPVEWGRRAARAYAAETRVLARTG